LRDLRLKLPVKGTGATSLGPSPISRSTGGSATPTSPTPWQAVRRGCRRIFACTLNRSVFLPALSFISSCENQAVPVGVATAWVESPVYHRRSLMVRAPFASMPVAFGHSCCVGHCVSALTGSVNE
jgi:hypothetical protein